MATAVEPKADKTTKRENTAHFKVVPETRDLPVTRYELRNLGAVNFIIPGLLGAGATSTLRLDAQAKALGEWLRARTTKVPRVLVESRPLGEGT